MHIEMPQIPDDDVSPLKPDLKWLGWMLAVLACLGLFCYIFFYGFSYVVIANLSIQDEKKYFGDLVVEDLSHELKLDFLSTKPKIPEYIDLYEVDSDEANAFATLGGKIIFTRALLEQLTYEEELLFVLGHEMEHIKNRDVVRGVATKIPFYLTLMYLGIDMGINSDDVFQLGSSFASRQIEIRSDLGGIQFVKAQGGNVDCILHFFQDQGNLFQRYLLFSSTHPSNEARIKQIKSYGKGTENDFSKCHKLNKNQLQR